MTANLRPRVLQAMALCALLPTGRKALPQQPVPQPPPAASATQTNSATGITLEDAIRRAEANEPAFAAAAAESRALALERTDAKAALLPTAIYHNQVIYTQPNGTSNRIGQTTGEPAPIFIANNAVREYASQGAFDEKIGLSSFGAIRLADA
ncbi:MAG TPA: hypothetical protein VLI45_00290, partial [Acidobacteriaceae bacterium]|nr:hypothetical protein [Acidobacteriaceae bacterium]